MRRLFAPEVVQTSALDCGPAALKSLLAGFGIQADYGRLREACQTALDGTSIDTIESVANSLGLEAEQLLLPVEHLFSPESNVLPAIVVVTLPNGLSHFVVIWRRHGCYLQVMDPALGRRWIRADRFSSEIYRHRLRVPASGWREFAGSDDFCRVLSARLIRAGVSARAASEALRQAAADPGWRSLAALDAACRALTAIQQARHFSRSSEADRVLQSLYRQPAVIPDSYWPVSLAKTTVSQSIPSSAIQPEEDEEVWVRGAVLVSAQAARRGFERKRNSADLAASGESVVREFLQRVLRKRAQPVEQTVPPELSSASTPFSIPPLRQIFRYLRAYGILTPAYLGLAVAAIVGGVLVEALLFRGLFDFASELHIPGQRIAAVAALSTFSFIVFLLEILTYTGTTRVCRRLETSFRLAFLRKVPRLPDRYFQSRLQSDLGERSHATHRLRDLPSFYRGLLAAILELTTTAGGIVWLEPATAPFVGFAVAAALLPALLSRACLNESDLRTRTHAGALTRFYLDAMLGLASIRAHGAEDNLRRAHAGLLEKWIAAALRLQRAVVTLEAIQVTAMFAAIAVMFLANPLRDSNVGRLLLVAYWALNLPTCGQRIGVLARQLPTYRSLVLRLCDAIGAEEEPSLPLSGSLKSAPAIRFQNVSAEAGGHAILSKIDLEIAPGSHIAIVGASGAGKSSLIGMLLGWLLPKEGGNILVDGAPLNAAQIRQAAAWIDPAIQIWNQSLYANLTFGSEADAHDSGEAIDAAHLRTVLQDLPEGLQTVLGEGGGRLSGGEGQRVRLARAILRGNAPLVLLDEPFRGLDRELREQLLAEARHRWSRSTLLCVTHDLAETRSFDRVLVFADGRIIEQGSPADLLASPNSQYRHLLESEEKLRNGLWHPRHWRRIKMQSGRIAADIPSRDLGQHAADAEVA